MKKRILSCFMALALCLTLLPAAALAAPTHQTHPICSGQTCSHTGQDGTEHPSNAFATAKWLTSSSGKLSVQHSPTSSSGDRLAEDGNYVILEEGYYYLSNAVENYDHLTYVGSLKTIKIQGNVTICLNGTQIQKVGTTAGSVFEVPAGNTLTLTDCKGRGQVTCDNTNDNGSGVYVNGGTLNLYSGQITQSYGQKGTDSNKYGGGVYVNGGEFEMNDTASVTGNTATGNKKGDNGYGGGVYVNSGTFNMNGSASITKNNAAAKSYGGGVFVNRGTFNMTGGAITPEEKRLGVSLLLINTAKGAQMFDSLPLHRRRCSLAEAVAADRALRSPTPVSVDRSRFFDALEQEPFRQVCARFLSALQPREAAGKPLKELLGNVRLPFGKRKQK